MRFRHVWRSILFATALVLLAACSHTLKTPSGELDLDQISFRSAWTADGTVRLTNGAFREPAAPGSAAELVIQATGDVARGEINGTPSAAVILTTNAGGSGTFFDLALLQWQSGTWINTDTVELGDRVEVHGVIIQGNTIRVDLTAHGPGDPICCPSLRMARDYVIQNNRLTEHRPATRPTAPPSIVGRIWKWQHSRYNNDTESVPPNPDRYSFQLLADGNISVRADCNRAGGTYRIENQQIIIEITHSTMAGCPPDSLEQTFLKDLNAAAIYFIREETLYIDMKYDSGTMAFRP